MIIKILTILLLLCILSYLVTNRKKPFLFLKTLFMGVVFIFIGYISLAISAVIIYGIIQFITIDFGSFFLMGIILILISSIFQLFIVRLLFRKKECRFDRGCRFRAFNSMVLSLLCDLSSSKWKNGH